MTAINQPELWGAGPVSQATWVPGVLRGYRLMDVRRLRTKPQVWTLHGARQPWPGRELRATCPEPEPCSEPPGDNCTCGIYHGYQPSFGTAEGVGLYWLCVTESSGATVLGTLGFRSSFTRVVAAARRSSRSTPPPESPWWYDQYRVMDQLGIQTFLTAKDLVTAFPPDDLSSLLPPFSATA